MTDKQSNHVDSINNVCRIYTDNQAIIDTKPDVAAQFGILLGKKTLISIAIGGQSGSTATNKEQIRKDLDEFSYGIIAPMKSWAITQNNETIRGEMDYSQTKLGAVKDDTYPEFLRHRKGVVDANMGSLAGLGFTPVLTLTWEGKIVMYEAVTTDPRQAIINRAVHTDNLDKYIKEAMKQMDEVLDGYMVLFKTAGTMDLYNKYVKAREIIDLKGPGTGGGDGVSALIKCFITDSGDSSPIEGVTAKLLPSGQEKHTGPDGSVKFDGVVPGMYNLELSASGYASVNVSLDAPTPGEYIFTFQMVKMP